MSFETMAWAIQQTTGAMANKFALICLANRVNKDHGLCIPKIKSIAEDMEASESTVKRALKELEERGIITMIPRFKDGVQLSNSYRLNVGGQPEGGGFNLNPGGSNVNPRGVQIEPRVGSNRPTEPVREPGTEPVDSSSHGLSAIPAGQKLFVDTWNTHAKTSGLAEIREWTSKRSKKLKSLAAVYKTGMAEAMKLSIQECHRNDWCIAQRTNVDHILVADNFQRYLDKARTPATAVPEGQTSASATGGAGGREEPVWAKEKRLKAEAYRREIEGLRKKRAKCVSDRGENTLDVSEIDKTIEGLKTKIMALGHEP